VAGPRSSGEESVIPWQVRLWFGTPSFFFVLVVALFHPERRANCLSPLIRALYILYLGLASAVRHSCFLPLTQSLTLLDGNYLSSLGILASPDAYSPSSGCELLIWARERLKFGFHVTLLPESILEPGFHLALVQESILAGWFQREVWYHVAVGKDSPLVEYSRRVEGRQAERRRSSGPPIVLVQKRFGRCDVHLKD
jgi:hypothetical protein